MGLLDLDGVVYVGPDPVPGAAAALREAVHLGMRTAFVTNNASRTPEQVARHLTDLGVAATPADVVTSAQAVARVLRERLSPGAAVLVAGAEGLRVAVRDAGFALVDSADDAPAAVAQGYDATIAYPALAEAALAVGRGALWVAANGDRTMPSARGRLPGNGALVALVAAATGQTPVVAGKPEPALHAESVQRTGARRPLVVGDRLDTDIEGAVRAGVDSLLVLTGVTDAPALLAAPPGCRPAYLALDLAALLHPQPAVEVEGVAATASCVTVAVGPDGLRVQRFAPPAGGDAREEGLALLRAAAAAAWTATDGGAAPARWELSAADDRSRAAAAAVGLSVSS